jgi:hypothetical protein
VTAWIQIALAFLKIVNAILDYTSYERAKQAGIDEEIARQSALILRKTGYVKQALENFGSKPGSADDFLRSLEPSE